MSDQHRYDKAQLLSILEEVPFEHLTSSVHVLGDSGERRHELAGVSLYSNARGWMAQVNWRAVVEADEITLRVGDMTSGERAYELRDSERVRIRVEDEGGDLVTEEELSALVAQSTLAKTWEQDVVSVLKDSQAQQATLH